jgi:hypothetical protein
MSDPKETPAAEAPVQEKPEKKSFKSFLASQIGFTGQDVFSFLRGEKSEDPALKALREKIEPLQVKRLAGVLSQPEETVLKAMEDCFNLLQLQQVEISVPDAKTLGECVVKYAHFLTVKKEEEKK